jgi:hypothetical protein
MRRPAAVPSTGLPWLPQTKAEGGLAALGAGVVVGDEHHVLAGFLAGADLVGADARLAGVVRVVHRPSLEHDDGFLVGAQRAQHRGRGPGWGVRRGIRTSSGLRRWRWRCRLTIRVRRWLVV